MTAALPPSKGPWLLAADLGLLGLGLALALSCARLFEGLAAAVLCLVATGAWALTTSLRRSPLRPLWAELIYLSVAAVLAVAVSLTAEVPEESGPAGSAPALVHLVRDDFASFATDIAPVPAGTGHLLVMGALIWLLASFASTASIRLRSPVQGALPHTVAILGLGLLARGTGRVLSSAALVVALGVYCTTQAAWRNAALRWVPRPSQGVVEPLRSATVLVGLSALVALVLTPLLPGGTEPVVEYRSGGLGDGRRNVVSPFVEVGSNLGPRSDDLLFTVRTDQPSYWRLTALDEYDPDTGIWVLSNSYEPVEGPLRTPTPAETVAAQVQVRSLGGFWVPSVDDVVTARSERELGWDEGAGSLIVRGEDLAEDDRVELAHAPDDPDAGELAAAGTPAERSVDPLLLAQDGVPVTLRVQAREVAGDLAPYEAALALQDWLRNDFTYDQSIDLSSSPDPMAEFLELRRGFCQQFASAFALAARTLGIPARVVVGFTTGDLMPGYLPTYAVYGRHAHAWPEVLLDGLGWVAFEPTPGRGDPSGTETTGVPGQQAPAPDGDTEVTSPETTAAPAPSTPSTSAPAGGDQLDADAPPEGADEDGPPVVPIVLGVLAAVVAGVAAVLWRRRSARRRHVIGAEALAAWDAALRLLEPRGLHPGDQETPLEFAGRVQRRLGTGAVGELARVESKRRWASDPPDAEDLVRADAAAQLLRRFLEEGPSAELAEVGASR
jgi:transglutaminase-like putative cysteine protease